MSRRAETLQVVQPRPSSVLVHLLLDSTGLRLCGPGEWLVEKHGARTRLSWRADHQRILRRAAIQRRVARLGEQVRHAERVGA